MNYLLVGFTLVVLTMTMVGVAALGSDRLFPARRTIGYIAEDGIDIEPGSQMPLLLSSSADSDEFSKIRFATSLVGYNKDEVDEVFTRLVIENERLRARAHKPWLLEAE